LNRQRDTWAKLPARLQEGIAEIVRGKIQELKIQNGGDVDENPEGYEDDYDALEAEISVRKEKQDATRAKQDVWGPKKATKIDGGPVLEREAAASPEGWLVLEKEALAAPENWLMTPMTPEATLDMDNRDTARTSVVQENTANSQENRADAREAAVDGGRQERMEEI
jgi:hypothetical protein